VAPNVFGLCGWSKAGKTTLIERLVPELVHRGHRVGTLKHDVHGFLADTPGTDSWRHAAAGAIATLIAGPDGLALQRHGPPPPPEFLVGLLGDVDLVLAEGFKGAPWPKLELHRGTGPLACPDDPWLVAVAGPVQPLHCPVPWYHWDEIGAIIDLVENIYSLRLKAR